jgi:hypothetical protein
MADNLALVGAIFFVLLCVVAYFPLKTRLEMPDVQSLSWGYAISQALPLLIASFAIMGSLVMVYVAGRGGINPNK